MNTNTKNPAVPTKEMLAEWADDTDWNYHGEVREKIAKWAVDNAAKGSVNALRLEHVYEAFKELNKIHDKDGCANAIYHSTETISHYLHDLLVREYGEETAQLIWKCL